MEESPEITIVLLGDAGVDSKDSESLPVLHDLDQPFVFDVKLFNRPYRFEFCDTASPRNYTLLHPDVVVLCYDISNPESLTAVKEKWSKEVHIYYEPDRPTLMLGLKRDLRTKELPDPLVVR
ncbi:hypothetical protein GP486_003761 [Trichoglossum hirsutum]|uniref:Uncharacterized protein n=1 Tax=Trichoglossum hirsutum TaxID=265104 RepID=A0A9P8RQR3_9PEZI|nr:hypothetical protein GP486_003761 [Trichoglossum hirsutum]